MGQAGRVAVVTGAASGIGQALARRFAADGHRIVLADLDADLLAEAAAELTGGGAEVLAVPTDVTDPAAVDWLAEASVERFGTVHIVCNNAGTVLGGSVWDVPLADWHRLIDVNLWGVIHGIRSFVPILLAHDEPAHVVNTASMAAVTALAGLGPYVASKHAVLGVSEVLFHDLAAAGAGDRIGVTIVCPGYVPTRIGISDRRAPVAPPPPGGLSADDVAARVAEAIAERRNYVFTHEGSTETVVERGAAIAEGRIHLRRR